MVAAPHTSNWDLIITIAAFEKMKIPLKFTIKKEWLNFPFNLLLSPLGAIPIDRNSKDKTGRKTSYTEAMINLFKERDSLVVMVTPEGTRSKKTEWKTGFYYVAEGANVPIALGYLDYKNKIAGVGKLVYTGDLDKTMREIMAFYKDITPYKPENFSPDLRYI
jgi:1-acyl-sn-glycerol-3-phosphate acyltransferase